jgi:hypothetical protein
VSESNLQEELDGVLVAARQEVAARRARGDFPPGLEREMERHFDELVHGPSPHDFGARRLQDVLDRTSVHLPADRGVVLASRVPGGATVHAAVGRVVSRQTEALVAQLATIRAEMEAALRVVLDGLRAIEGHEHQHLTEAVSGVLDRIAVLDSIVLTVAEHDERLQVLESAVRAGR